MLTAWRQEWAVEFQGLAAALSDLIGTGARRIDHIGSTSVPHLVAKDVIDLQVIVESLDSPDLLRAFNEGGYTQRTQPWNIRDHVPASWQGNPSRWSKLVFAPPPGTRICKIHVRLAGSPNERYAVLFRDYLRSNDTARESWERFKTTLSSVAKNLSEYGKVKDPATDVLMLAAEQWALASGWSVSET